MIKVGERLAGTVHNVDPREVAEQLGADGPGVGGPLLAHLEDASGPLAVVINDVAGVLGGRLDDVAVTRPDLPVVALDQSARRVEIALQGP